MMHRMHNCKAGTHRLPHQTDCSLPRNRECSLYHKKCDDR